MRNLEHSKEKIMTSWMRKETWVRMKRTWLIEHVFEKEDWFDGMWGEEWNWSGCIFINFIWFFFLLRFSRFGNLIEVYLVSGKNVGYAKYADRISANDAITTLHGKILNGVRLKVMLADSPREESNKRQRTYWFLR